MLLDDQEVALPFGRGVGDVPPDDEAHPGLAAQGHLADRVLERGRIDGHAEAGGQDLAVELRRGRPVDPAVDPGRAVGPVLVGAEVASEPGHRDRVAERAPPLHRQADAIGIAGLEGLHGHGDGAALRRAFRRELGDLRVVDRDGQPVPVLGALGPGRGRAPGRRAPGPWPCAGSSRGRTGGRAASRSPGRARAPGAGRGPGQARPAPSSRRSRGPPPTGWIPSQ